MHLSNLVKIRQIQLLSVILTEKLCDYCFLVTLVMWYDILNHIIVVRKSMLTRNINLKTVINLFKNPVKNIFKTERRDLTIF